MKSKKNKKSSEKNASDQEALGNNAEILNDETSSDEVVKQEKSLNSQSELEEEVIAKDAAVKDFSNNTSSEKEQNVERHGEPEKKSSLFSRFFKGLINRQIFQKVFSLLFALVVFGAVYFQMEAHRSILSYLGVMLLMVVVYAEILIIRDHLWVLEGSMRESRRWRDIFFNQTSLRRQRFRKVVVMIFALGIFSYVYMRASTENSPALSFMGIILMITILYYEILTVRDEVFIMMQAVVASEEEKAEITKPAKEHEKFLAEKNKE
jgi:hypothetical protein